MSNKIGTEIEINKALKNNNLHAKKKFGQNFLKDDKVLSSICDISECDKDTLVIEVGPGLGGLTEFLCERAGYVIAYEIDTDLIDILHNNLSRFNNYEIINKDILTVDVNKDIDRFQYKKVYLVANLPYYITTPIITKLLTETERITRYVVLLQKEVAHRLAGKPSTKDYGAITLAIEYRGKAKVMLEVNRNAFIPAPNVDSSVLRIDIYDNKMYFPKDEKALFDLIRLAFNQRRKTLVNNLLEKYNKDFILKMLEDNGYKVSIRAEELTLNDFIKLGDYIISKE